ncbi:hypothetical protein RQP46_000541 [Phenoliferia psychrophenolica]
MRWTVALVLAVLPVTFASHSDDDAVLLARRQTIVANGTSSAQRVGAGLKTNGTAVTSTGINVGFHIDWNGGDRPGVLNSRLGRPAALIGGYIHLNLTDQDYHELAAQLPYILPLAATSVYSPAVLPQFTLENWTSAMTQTLATQMASLNAQGITVWLRFAYEMNGAWMDFGQDPAQYILVWQEVVTAVRAVAPLTYFLWSPNVHPQSLDGISGYTEYYPTAAYVDLAGLSFYNLGSNQVTNDVPETGYFSDNFQSFYDTYAAAHPIIVSETSAPEHYIVPTEFADLPEDSELPGGADAVDFAALTPANGTATSELQRKSVWFEQMTGTSAATAYPNLLAVMWFNLAKIGGYNGVLRVNDYRAIKLGNDTLTQYFRTAIGESAWLQTTHTSTTHFNSKLILYKKIKMPSSWTIDFAGKTVVVTGGNKGLGRGMAEALCKANATVAIIYNSATDAHEVAAGLAKQYGVKVKAYQCNVGDNAKVKATFKQIEADLGNIAGVVANAGISIVKPALELDATDFKTVFDVNVLGVFNTCQAAAALWVERKQPGSIVIISSMSSQIVNSPLTQCFYNSSKGAVSNLGKCLAAEWAPYKIRVNMVSPGFIKTDQTSHMPAELRDAQAKQVPMGRFSEPIEQTGQALLLLSDHSSYQTGSENFVDGGFLIW